MAGRCDFWGIERRDDTVYSTNKMRGERHPLEVKGRAYWLDK
jgi:hypothetical protein